MDKDKFIETCFEIAFGADAINRDFKHEEVLERLQYYSNEAFILERVIEVIEDDQQ